MKTEKIFLTGTAKKVISVAAALLFATGSTIPASAESFTGDDSWKVSFTETEKMESSFQTADLNEAVSGLQPGDDITFHMKLENDNGEATRWYMTNEVLYSLEDRSANSKTGGGAYTYELTYTDKDGNEEVLFSSNTVGGEVISKAGEGLHEATDSLKDYFYLDTLTKEDKGTVTLTVALDGETQGNDYQDTLADLQMNFAVELAADTPSADTPTGDTKEPPALSGRTKVVKTGDESRTILYAGIAAASGLLILGLGIYGVRSRKREEEAEG